MSAGREIRLSQNDDGSWTAQDVETGVASQGASREEALTNLDDAVVLHNGEAGRDVTEDDLREWGIDPDDAAEEARVPDAPWLE